MTKGWPRGGNEVPGRIGTQGRAGKPDHAACSLCSPSPLPCLPPFGLSDVCPSFLCASLLSSGVLFNLYLSPSSCLSLPFLFPSSFGLSLISFILPFFLFLSFCVLLFSHLRSSSSPYCPRPLPRLWVVAGLQVWHSHRGGPEVVWGDRTQGTPQPAASWGRERLKGPGVGPLCPGALPEWWHRSQGHPGGPR